MELDMTKEEIELHAFPTPSLGSYSGMTLRDYFAAKAMQGIIIHYKEGLRPQDCIVMAEDAYFIADAMIKARDA